MKNEHEEIQSETAFNDVRRRIFDFSYVSEMVLQDENKVFVADSHIPRRFWIVKDPHAIAFKSKNRCVD